MNNLQKKEFELLVAFIEACERLELKYYLVCGSALGAVKYGGFIPWDDDIDVALAREDYEVFVREAQAVLPDYFFLQNYKTDPAFPHIFSKMRDSRTTYMEKSVAHLPINHGVYIDIFPLDGYPSHGFEKVVFEVRKRSYEHQLHTVVNVARTWKSLLHYRFYRLLGCHKRIQKIASRYERMISRYATQESVYWCNHGNWQGPKEYAPAWQYGEGRRALFEGVSVVIPEAYDEYLRQKYGDYIADPPSEEQQGHHFYEVCDLENPYTDYVKGNGGIG